jgi:uncharacterized membrane protein YgdD (TMEM256/DUF423 family)
MPTDKLLTFLGALFSFLGVAAGAFGAHALRNRLPPDLLAIFETGVRYQMYHALALFAAAWASAHFSSGLPAWAGGAFAGGIVIFSGSLYVLAFTGVRAWGAVTPVGGLLFLVGWALLAVAAIRG